MSVGAARRLLTGLCAALVCAAAPGSRADAADDIGDLEGFGDAEFSDDFEVDVDPPSTPQRWLDLDGSVDVSSSWNYLSHRSPRTAPPPNGVSWTGLSRLRTRLNLQLDLEVPHDFNVVATPLEGRPLGRSLRGDGGRHQTQGGQAEYTGPEG